MNSPLSIGGKFEISSELHFVAILSLPVLDEKQYELAESLLQEVDFEKLRILINHHRVWPCVFCNVPDHFK